MCIVVFLEYGDTGFYVAIEGHNDSQSEPLSLERFTTRLTALSFLYPD